MKKILLLEDDTLLAQTVQELLESEGYRVDWASDGEEAAEYSYDTNYAMYIFDVNVPLIDGFELLESLREARDTTPTLFISARVDLQSIAHGFQSGAYDYIKKPFFPEELLIRVNAKIGITQESICCGDMLYNPISKEIRRNGERVAFGEVQQQLFELFMQEKGRIIDQEVLLECLENPSPAALRVALTKLKQNTGLNIKNIRGVGYTLETC
ncbi:MAG: response regulator transcription factor [Campylobacterota bacterium]|nr:response regulator transcription factor [Campylobacterota bacterium]